MRTLALIALALAGCNRYDAPAGAADTLATAPTREAWGVNLTVSDGPQLRVHLEAPYMATFDADTLVHVLTADSVGGRVEANLYGEAGQPTADLTADTLRYYERDRRFTATGRVVVLTPEGRRLETQRLTWLEAERTVSAPGAVHIVTDDEDVRGFDLTASEDLSTYRIRRVTAQVQVAQ